MNKPKKKKTQKPKLLHYSQWTPSDYLKYLEEDQHDRRNNDR